MSLVKKTKVVVLSHVFMATSMVSNTACAFDNVNTNKEDSRSLAFKGGNILNPGVDSMVSNATILIRDGNIVRIQPDSKSIPDSYSIVDIEGKWVIPGLIDGHIHLAQSGSAFTRPDTIDARQIQPYETDQRWLLDNIGELLNNYLKLGITSVYDMGGPSEYLSHYRNIASEGTHPDIYAAGTLISPMEIPTLSINGNTFTKVTTSEEAVSLVKRQLNFNTKIIKIVWSQETGLSTNELSKLYGPAIELAKQHNKTVAVHVEELANAKAAIKAGADVLVHSVMREPVDDEFIRLMQSHNVTYMPTLTAFSHYFELFKNELEFSQFELEHSHSDITGSFKLLQDELSKTDHMSQLLMKYVAKVDEPEANLAKLSHKDRSIVQQLRAIFSKTFDAIRKANLKRIVEAGVNVAVGTDAGNPGTLHASSMLGELLAWSQAGVSNKKILKAATFGNAVALNLDSQIGSLLSGMHANFVVLAQSPYENLFTLAKPEMTVKRGVLVSSDGEIQDEI